MDFFKKRYGRLGRLSKREWKEFLNSNKGLFKRAASAPSYIIGPTVDAKGQMTGDAMTMETVFFGQNTSKEQSEFLEELEKTNSKAAKEYMLTVTNSIERWKEDLKWLGVAVHYLEKEENVLKNEERIIERGERLKASLKLPLILKRHFPQLFGNVDLEGLGFEGILERVRFIEEKVRSEEVYLKRYVRKAKKEMSFLFK